VNLLLAAGAELNRAVARAVSAVDRTIAVATATTAAELADALRSGRYDVAVVPAALLADVGVPPPAGRGRCRIVLVVDRASDAEAFDADDFVLPREPVERTAEELATRIALARRRDERPSAAGGTGGDPGSPIDRRALEESCRESPSLMREIFCIYLEEAPERLRALRAGLGGSDYPAVARAAHSLANTSGTLNSEPAVAAARLLEEAARREDPAACREAAERLIPTVESILTGIGELLRECD